MWKRCRLNNEEYLIKHTVKNDLHTLYVTDLRHLWCEEVREDRLLQRCKDMNRLLEASDTELLKLVWSLVEGENNDIVSCFTDVVNGKQLSLQSNLDGLLKFKINFMLHLDDKQFFEKVSCPLLMTMSELEKRNRVLVDIIKKKDLEIAEYKLEGAKISRGAVETQVFDEVSFSKKCDEELGTTKRLVQSQPYQTFTPFIRGMLENTENASVITPQEHLEKKEPPPKQNYMGGMRRGIGGMRVKPRVTVRYKRAVFGDDDDDDDDDKDDDEDDDEDDDIDKDYIAHKNLSKRRSLTILKRSKRNAKVKKALSNL